MSAARPGWSDQQIEQTVGNLLRVGLAIATIVTAFGGAIYLYNHGSEATDYRVFHGEPADLRGIPGIISLTREWRGRGFIQLGLLILLATPVARVAFSIVAFAEQRDWFYVGVTVVVFGVLMFSIFGGYG